jgi:hypothetical protein
LAGNASQNRNRGFERIANEILAEAKATDEAEDELHGDARGDELPEQLRSAEGRREFFREARQRLETKDGRQQTIGAQPSATEPALSTEPREDTPAGDEPAGSEPQDARDSGYVFDAERIVARVQGREGWLRDARRQLEADRWQARNLKPHDERPGLQSHQPGKLRT